MKTCRIAEVFAGPTTGWVVLITNSDGTQHWGTMHRTEKAARSEADRLMSPMLDMGDGSDMPPVNFSLIIGRYAAVGRQVMEMPYSAAEPSRRRRPTTTIRWRTIAVFLPFALLIDAVVLYAGWFIWNSTSVP
jgi:hypothetical protein